MVCKMAVIFYCSVEDGREAEAARGGDSWLLCDGTDTLLRLYRRTRQPCNHRHNNYNSHNSQWTHRATTPRSYTAQTVAAAQPPGPRSPGEPLPADTTPHPSPCHQDGQSIQDTLAPPPAHHCRTNTSKSSNHSSIVGSPGDSGWPRKRCKGVGAGAGRSFCNACNTRLANKAVFASIRRMNSFESAISTIQIKKNHNTI